MNMDSNLLNSHSVHHPLSAGWGGEPPTKFSKRGGDLTEPQLLEGICWETRGIDFIWVGGGGVAILT